MPINNPQYTDAGRRIQSTTNLQRQPPSGAPVSRENMAAHATNGILNNSIANNINHNHQQSRDRSMKCFKRLYTPEKMSFKQGLVKRYRSQIAKLTPTSSSSSTPLNMASQLQVYQEPTIADMAPQLQPSPIYQHNNTSLLLLQTSSATIPIPHSIYRYQSKTPILDQPNRLQFITLEDFRCPCFMIAGEPFLSVPSLLKFLHHRFSLLRIVKTIEDFNINFTLATDQQMDILKLFVIAPSSRCCPLIKHSDADRITLDLHEQCYKRKAPRDASLYRKEKDLILLQNEKQDQLLVYSTHSYTTTCNTTALDQSLVQSCFPSDMFHHFHDIPTSHGPINLHRKNYPFANMIENSSKYNNDINSMKQNVPNQVFHTNQAQNLIQQEQPMKTTSFKNVTIRAYHKCFGKCIGLYYPELLHKSQYKCIECAACGRMFAPKRFIGHVHCPKEKYGCNWGFNSYNWPQYIRLCKRQATNSLGDMELVEQFRLLQRLTDKEQNQSDDLTEYNFDKLNYAEQLRQLTERQQDENDQSKPNSSSSVGEQSESDKKNDELASYRPPRALAEVVISAYTCILIDNYSATTTNTVYTSYTSSSVPPTTDTSSYNDPQPVGQPSFTTTSSIIGNTSGGDAGPVGDSSSRSSSTTMTTSYKFDDTNPMNIVPVSSSIDNYRSSTGPSGKLNLESASSTIYNHSSLSLSNTPHADYNYLYSAPHQMRLPPTVSHHELSDLEKMWHSHYQQHQQLGLEARHQQPIDLHSELKREIYISWCMNTYFRVTGIIPTLANNILEHILDTVRKSKFIT